MNAEDVANHIGEQYRRGHGYVRIPCYNSSFHNNDDRDPSLVIYDGDRGYYCFACGASGSHEWLMRQYGMNPSYRRPSRPIVREYKKYDFDEVEQKLTRLPDNAKEVMAGKNINLGMLDKLGWKWHEGIIEGWGAGIFIPYKANGKIVGARLRTLSGNVRFLSLPGGESFPFMIDNLGDVTFVCEGETDTLTMMQMGYSAVGIPGATNTRAIKKLIKKAKKLGTTLVVIPDNDKAGRDFFTRVRTAGREADVEVRILRILKGKDVNEWYGLDGEASVVSYLTELGYDRRVQVST